VFFTDLSGAPAGRVAFFLQKPPADEIRRRAESHRFWVDTGMWLLGARAVAMLMARCGWDEGRQRFRNGGAPDPYELYAELGPALGAHPERPDAGLSDLSCAVVPLPEPEFYHLGTSRQLIESVSRLQNADVAGPARGGRPLPWRHPDQFVQNAAWDPPVRRDANHTLWVENATVPASWRLAHGHVLTGVPDNQWALDLEPGVCLDFVPVGPRDWCVRVYGLDDPFRGEIGDAATRWMGRPVREWFAARGIDAESAGLMPTTDIQDAPLFPVVAPEQLDPEFVRWLFAASPPPGDPRWAERWRGLPRLSADAIGGAADLARLDAQRAAHRRRAALALSADGRADGLFAGLDLDATAALLAADGAAPLPPEPVPAPGQVVGPLRRAKDRMFRATLLRRRGQDGWQGHEAGAFGALRDALVEDGRLASAPVRCVLDDQILWGRSPVRLDLAGGWTDTPPYCLEHGGRVVNVAVNLNGQPPVQVFARVGGRPELVIRSIDLGVEERILRYDELDTFARPGSEFALAKAALALAGFLPRFHRDGGASSLVRQLEEFGGGIELSLLAAVPKGSGLGTSSILSATLLATLGELCGLSWGPRDLVQRTLVIEQMLTTGGGWQDQAGAIFKGIKRIETPPGLEQAPSVRWLPEHLFSSELANRRMLLYYTGLTRLARDILQDIVRGMFLNRAAVLDSLRAIGENADAAFLAIQHGDYDALCRSVGESWRLNQRLDAGTNPPAVQAILDRIGGDLAAGKLLGAGGGGYLLLLARDDAAARRIRETLIADPPNPRARFVDFQVSDTGLQVTRS
jgi:galactokinase/mevalonate kinase-like predicted kinase